MKYKSQNKRKISILVALVFLVAQLLVCMPIFAQKTTKTFANSSELTEYSESISITNGQFGESSGSKYPKKPTNWTASTNGSNENSLKAGVIDISTADFDKNKEDYGLSTNPDSMSSDDYILMLNGQENAINYGYNSASITLEANSYYTISFKALTQSKNNNGFSAYLVMDKLENDANNSFINIQTNVWNTYTFYITTGNVSINTNLDLWIGTKNQSKSTSGAVFFDNVKAQRYTQTAFNKLQKDTTTSRQISFANTSLNLIKNSSFENGMTDFTRITTGSDNVVSGVTSLSTNGFDTATTKIETAPSTNMTLTCDNNNNQKGLFINNLIETKTGYKSSKFTVNRFENLTVSVWVKTGKLSTNGANVILSEVVDNDEEITYTSQFTNINTSSYLNKFSNNWALYTFYVQGNPYKTIDLELQLWVGNEESETQGYAFFDEIRVSSVSSNEYSKATEGSYIKKLNLSNLESLDIANGAFNIVKDGNKIVGVNEVSDWTLSSESNIDAKYSGVINTKTEYYNNFANHISQNYNPGVIPNIYNNLGVDEVSNNILMIYNPILGNQTYTSSEFSLTAETTYKITFYATIAGNADFATVKIINNSNTLAKFVVDEENWTQYTIYIKNGKNTNNINFALSLGDEINSQSGFAYFDNFLSSTIEDDIYEISTNNKVMICDLSQENFLTTGDKVNEIYTPYLWTGTNNAENDKNIVAGIIDKQNSLLPFEIGKTDAKSSNRLVIYSPNDTHYTFTSKTNYTFKPNSYYQVDLTYKTYNLGQDEDNKILDSKNKAIPFGAFFEINSLNLKTNAITTTNDEWTTYTFYIKTSSTETASPIAISLGGSNALTKGGIAVSNISFVESTEDAFNEVKNLDQALGMKADLSDKNAPKDETDKNKGSSGPNLNLVDIAGIIIVVAVVVAMVGTIIKQARKRKKPVKTTIGKYDRNYNSKNNKTAGKIEDRLEEVEAELIRINDVINILTKTQNDLIAKRDVTTDAVESEKLLKQIEKINNELSYELDNRDSVLKEQKILKSMMNE